MDKQVKKDKYFILFLLLVSFVMFAFNFDGGVSGYNATLLGLTYANGILPRAFMGSIYYLMNWILPFDLYTYGNVQIFTFIATTLFIIFWCLLAYYFIKKTDRDYASYLEYIIVFVTLFVIGSFTAFFNYGRLDMYIAALTILATLILVSNKCEWLVIPISIVCVLIHEGYVFMYYNVILVIVLYKLIRAHINNDKSLRTKYIIIFAVSLICVSLIFGYYTFVYSGNEGAYESTLNLAKMLTYKEDYHKDVLRAEVLGENLFKEEWNRYHIGNIIELVFFLILFLPFLIIQGKVISRLIKTADNRLNKWQYIIFAIGAATTLPLFILKVDFGRWILSVIVYYCLVMIALIAMNDKGARRVWAEEIDYIRSKTSYGKLLLVYAMLFVPLLDVNICNVTGKMLDVVERLI